MEYFQKAIDLDSNFALAYAGFADANLLLATYGLAHPRQVMMRAKQLADKAIQLDPTLSEAYCSLGYYYACYEWNWAEAKMNFLKSIELKPDYAEAHYRYSWNYLACVEGKFDEAEKHGAIAIKLEPLSSICYANYSLTLGTSGKFKEAIAACKTGIELDANAFLCYLNAGSVYTALGQYDEAISSYETAMKLSNRHHFALSPLILTYCITGNLDKARSLMDELKEKALTGYIANTFTAFSVAYLDGLDEAFNYLEKAFADHDPLLLMLKHQPLVPSILKQDPRYQGFLERIGFP
jgi:adenylate cyclase